ncbi:hypothetical protein AcW1_009411 [Taiwanofungus camphoratus]|nr:hypothetical protein AcV7_003912 [Antrodia cinnamomea]KAI0947717.1 hypothetical protein AcW1_009411 [Antrodia cinnamomea]
MNTSSGLVYRGIQIGGYPEVGVPRVSINVRVYYCVQREWAVLLPAYSIMLVLLTYVTYFALALSGTPSFSDISTITDSKAHLPAINAPNPYLAHAQSNAIPEMYDIPIGIVNRVVYGTRNDEPEPSSEMSLDCASR